MSGKQKARVAIFAVLLFCTLAAMIGSTVFFVTELCKPNEALSNGEQILIEEKKVYGIYCEASAPPAMRSYEFQFKNNETGELIVSKPPMRDESYSIGAVKVQSEIKSGTFGTLVANVMLDAGTYTITFAPPEAGNTFVWENDMALSVVKYIASMLLLALLLVAFVVCLVLTLVLKKKRS